MDPIEHVRDGFLDPKDNNMIKYNSQLSTEPTYPVTISPAQVGKLDWVPNNQETCEDYKSPTIDTNSESDLSAEATVSQSIIAPCQSKCR